MKKHIKETNEARFKESIKKEIKRLKEEIGYTWKLSIHPPYLKQPDVSISEKVNQICKHLGIEIVKTKPEVKIEKTLPPKGEKK